MGDAEGAVVAVAEFLDVQAVLGGQHCGPGGREDVVHWRGADGDERLEPVHHAPLEQLPQPHPAGPKRRKGQGGDLVGGEHAVLVQHPDDPPIARGQPPRQHRLVIGVVRRARGGPRRLVASKSALPGGIGDHDTNLRKEIGGIALKELYPGSIFGTCVSSVRLRGMLIEWAKILPILVSVTSTCVSIVAATVAYRGFRTARRSFEIQRKQLDELAELRAREYAVGFCVWLEDLGDSWVMMVHNSGSMPVYDVYVYWDLDDPVTWSGVIGEMPAVPEDEHTGLLGEWEFGNVGPTSEPRREDRVGEWIREGAAHCVGVLTERDHGLLFPPGFETAFKNLRLRTVFTDVAGVRWERRGARLERQDDWWAAETDQLEGRCLVPAAG